MMFGANDMGSLMIEENVVAEAGTVHYLSLKQIREAISELAFSLNKWAQLALSDPQSDGKRLFNGRFAHTVCADETDSEGF